MILAIFNLECFTFDMNPSRSRRRVLKITSLGLISGLAGCTSNDQNQSTTNQTTNSPSPTSTTGTDSTPSETNTSTEATTSTVKGEWTHKWGSPFGRRYNPEFSAVTPPFTWQWQKDLTQGIPDVLLLQENTLYESGSSIRAITADTGRQQWQGGQNDPIGILGDKLIYQEGILSLSDGKTTVNFDNRKFVPTLVGDGIFGQTEENTVGKASVTDGTLQWEKRVEAAGPASEGFVDTTYGCFTETGLVATYTSGESDERGLVSLRRGDGSLEWEQGYDGSAFPRTELSTPSGVVVSAKTDQGAKFNWHRADTGKKQWEMPNHRVGPPESTIAANDDTMFTVEARENQSRLVIGAYALADGSKRWQTDVTPDQGSPFKGGFHKLFVANKTIYASIVPDVSGNGGPPVQTYAINTVDGSKRWVNDQFMLVLPANNGLLSVSLADRKWGLLVPES